MSLLSRMQRTVSGASKLSASRTFQVARDLDVEFRPVGQYDLDVNGPRDALTYLAPALLTHKSALRRGACRTCLHGLAEDGGHCPWCEVVRGRRTVYAPGSEAEARFLAALETQEPPERRRAA